MTKSNNTTTVTETTETTETLSNGWKRESALNLLDAIKDLK